MARGTLTERALRLHQILEGVVPEQLKGALSVIGSAEHHSEVVKHCAHLLAELGILTGAGTFTGSTDDFHSRLSYIEGILWAMGFAVQES